MERARSVVQVRSYSRERNEQICTFDFGQDVVRQIEDALRLLMLFSCPNHNIIDQDMKTYWRQYLTTWI